MNPVPWLQMTNMISYQGLVRTFLSVRHLAAVDSEALQQQGALGVIILGQQVHAIFGKQSDALRQLLDEHFAARK